MANKKVLKLLPLSDVHYGSSTFNEELFEKWLEIARGSKHKKILLMGDLIDMNDANRFYKPNDSITLNDQINYIIDALKPFKKDIICNLIGNHGIRAKKQFDLDTDQLIGDALGVATTQSYHEDLRVKAGAQPKYIRVFAQHQTPSSKSTLLAMRRFISSMEQIDAELYLAGHNHRSLFITKIYRTLDYTPLRRHYLFTGDFLNYKGSYADNGSLSFKVPSFSTLSIDTDKNVHSRTYFGDDVE